MSSGIISAKYQIVIPKELRRQLSIKPGQRVQLSADNNGTITIDTTSKVRQVAGKYTGVWGADSAAYVRELRDEWETRPSPQSLVLNPQEQLDEHFDELGS